MRIRPAKFGCPDQLMLKNYKGDCCAGGLMPETPGSGSDEPPRAGDPDCAGKPDLRPIGCAAYSG
jgi:hypothetical protein